MVEGIALSCSEKGGNPGIREGKGRKVNRLEGQKDGGP